MRARARDTTRLEAATGSGGCLSSCAQPRPRRDLDKWMLARLRLLRSNSENAARPHTHGSWPRVSRSPPRSTRGSTYTAGDTPRTLPACTSRCPEPRLRGSGFLPSTSTLDSRTTRCGPACRLVWQRSGSPARMRIGAFGPRTSRVARYFAAASVSTRLRIDAASFAFGAARRYVRSASSAFARSPFFAYARPSPRYAATYAG